MKVPMIPQTLSSETFGPASRYRLDEFLGRDGVITWFVLDAETIDPETRLPAVVAQAETKSAALDPFGPWCARCEAQYRHGCNTAYCSPDCEEADLVEGKDANGWLVEFEADGEQAAQ